MDLCLYAKNNKLPISQAAEATGLTPDQVQRVFEDIDTKRATTRYLHMGPVLVDEVPEIKNVRQD
jgi:NAD+ synthase